MVSVRVRDCSESTCSGFKKNTLHIGARLKELQQLGVVMLTLNQLCDDILAFAEAV